MKNVSLYAVLIAIQVEGCYTVSNLCTRVILHRVVLHWRPNTLVAFIWTLAINRVVPLLLDLRILYKLLEVGHLFEEYFPLRGELMFLPEEATVTLEPSKKGSPYLE